MLVLIRMTFLFLLFIYFLTVNIAFCLFRFIFPVQTEERIWSLNLRSAMQMSENDYSN